MENDLLYKSIDKIGGVDAVKIAKELQKRGKATEDDIAKTTGIKLNDVRKILFKLHKFSLAVSDSIQDTKTGWLIFYWRLQPDQMESVIRTQKRRVLEKLESRLEFEKSHEFYQCANEHCGKFTFEEAMESLFRCPKCDGHLEHFDNSRIIETLENKIKQLKEELKSE